MQTLEFSVHEGVAKLVLNRPAQRNAIDAVMIDELKAVIDQLRTDATIKSLVITGAGGAFCAGGDLRGRQNAPSDPESVRTRMKSINAMVRELITLDMAVICAVDGPAYGAGFSLALAADFVLATPQARFCLSFMRIGAIPDFGAFYTLPRTVGLQAAKELVLSAREIDSEEARRLGIVFEIQPQDRLLDRAVNMASSFTHASRTAIGLVKSTLDASWTSDLGTVLEMEANGQAIASSTGHTAQAIARFLDKKPALFQWPADH